jgi:hypothetical protein
MSNSNKKELKFVSVNVDDIRNKLQIANAINLYPSVLCKRYTFNPIDPNKKGQICVYTENGKVMMMVKTYPANSESGVESVVELKDNITVEKGREFLLQMGLTQRSYRESICEKWAHEKCKIVLTTMPGIDTFTIVECDGANENELKDLLSKLGVDESVSVTGSYDKQYMDAYGVTQYEINNQIPQLTFENIDTDLGVFVRKNQEELMKKKALQLPLYLSLVQKMQNKNKNKFVNASSTAAAATVAAANVAAVANVAAAEVTQVPNVSNAAKVAATNVATAANIAAMAANIKNLKPIQAANTVATAANNAAMTVVNSSTATNATKNAAVMVATAATNEAATTIATNAANLSKTNAIVAEATAAANVIASNVSTNVAAANTAATTSVLENITQIVRNANKSKKNNSQRLTTQTAGAKKKKSTKKKSVTKKSMKKKSLKKK